MWFSARLLFRSSVHDGAETPPLYEESIIIVRGEDDAGASAEAERIGLANEHSYLNPEGLEVRWRFVRLLELQELGETELTSGVEVYSRLFRSASEPK